MIVFSFWPDVIMIKEIGDPMQVATHLNLDRKELKARIVMAQGRQNTNYAINLYACHPFFHRRLRHHDQRREHRLHSHQGISDVPGIRGIRRLSVRFRGLHPYPPLYHKELDLGLDLQARHHAAGRRRSRRPSRRRAARRPEADLPAAHHRRAQLCDRLAPGPQPFHGAGPQEAAARGRGRPSGTVRLFLGNVRPGFGHSGPGQTQRFSTHVPGHRHRRPGSPGGSICRQTDPLPLRRSV
jgi:hypothetical protein